MRSDLEHQVNHNAEISHFYHVFSSYEEGGPTGAGKTRCLAVTFVGKILCLQIESLLLWIKASFLVYEILFFGFKPGLFRVK